ncbi:hypothetical protein EPR50_G00056400 [Perca flavescens]|uniref:Uncharacterized protein n=1 Tax=Perca flavescens TaxID=8167 RepID=A0A484DDA7_PERFV|nr:hypothetical protein EPR50_G00056400 [Perca flavescens]
MDARRHHCCPAPSEGRRSPSTRFPRRETTSAAAVRPQKWLRRVQNATTALQSVSARSDLAGRYFTCFFFESKIICCSVPSRFSRLRVFSRPAVSNRLPI